MMIFTNMIAILKDGIRRHITLTAQRFHVEAGLWDDASFLELFKFFGTKTSENYDSVTFEALPIGKVLPTDLDRGTDTRDRRKAHKAKNNVE